MRANNTTSIGHTGAQWMNKSASMDTMSVTVPMCAVASPLCPLQNYYYYLFWYFVRCCSTIIFYFSSFLFAFIWIFIFITIFWNFSCIPLLQIHSPTHIYVSECGLYCHYIHCTCLLEGDQDIIKMACCVPMRKIWSSYNKYRMQLCYVIAFARIVKVNMLCC